MGFLKKLFTRKNSKKALSASSSDSYSRSQNTKLSRKERKALKHSNKAGSFLQPSGIASRSGSYAQDHGASRRSESGGGGGNFPRQNEEYARKPSFSSQIRGGGSGSGSTISPSDRSMKSRNERDHGQSHSRRRRHESSQNHGHPNQQQQQQQQQHRNPSGNQGVHSRSERRYPDNGYDADHSFRANFQDRNDENINNINSRSPDKSQDSYHHRRHNQNHSRTNNADHNANVNGNGNGNGNTNLRYENVQQFEKQVQNQPRRSNNNSNVGRYPYEEAPLSKKMLQLHRLPNGQLTAMDKMATSSPMSVSSEFDLSTDAEDNEYNVIRQRSDSYKMNPMLKPYSPSDASSDGIGLNPMKSPLNMYVSESQSIGDEGMMLAANRSRHYFSDSDHESTLNSPNGSMASSSVKHHRASPTQDTIASNEIGDGVGAGYQNGKSRFTFDSEFETALVNSKRKSPLNGEQRPPSPTAFQKINKTQKYDDEKSKESFDSAMSPRALAIQAAKNMRAKGKPTAEPYLDARGGVGVGAGGEFLPPRMTHTQGSQESEDLNENSRPGRNEGVIENLNFADFESNAFDTHFSNNTFGRTSKTVADPTSPVTELLAEAKARRENRNKYADASTSVNSEPVLNTAILRQQIKQQQSNNAFNRVSTGSSEAKEKLKQRRMEKEQFLRKWENKNENVSDDDSEKEKKVNESWLFDEVAGALGPRGIAADLESLGERSNRSKTSQGNKSLRSHRSHRSNKSYKSHKSSSSHRLPKRSDESVGSRHSRSSRYSIKSTRSHLSQMSQESRSVANDLIRLEMQLAMVGANLKSGENEVKKQLELDVQRKGFKDSMSIGESSLGMRSYSSRKSKSSRQNITVPKRVKTHVRAPPGKLGIILANKTDSKGTVVSGVRTTSVLADKISPGDRIIAIDGEDVNRMTVPEITAIMARKNDFERLLTVLIMPPK